MLYILLLLPYAPEIKLLIADAWYPACRRTPIASYITTIANTAATANDVSAVPLSTPAPVANATTNEACEDGNPPDPIANEGFHFFVPT